MKRILLVLAILAVALGLYLYLGRPATPSEAERNRAFAESMTGVTLAGQSTRLGRDGVFGPERYHIQGVTHVSGDMWLLRARWDYHGTEITVPIPLAIQWAGDTPVITLTDLAIPGVGTYTARVVLYRGQYAGTWSGKDGGGQLFGKIESPTAKP
jgi:hypothetical protein